MEFYKNWLQKNTEANERAKRRIQQIDQSSSSAQAGVKLSLPTAARRTFAGASQMMASTNVL